MSQNATTSTKPRVTWAQRREAKRIGLALPFPCSKAKAGFLIGQAHRALMAADQG